MNHAEALAADVRPDRAKGIIPNVSIMSIGPAAGHGFRITARTLESLVEAMEANPGVKCRITHPELEGFGSDGSLYVVGVPFNLRVDGDRVRGDIQLGKYARHSPQGDMWEYLLGIADEHPQILGISVYAYFDFHSERDPQTGEELDDPEATVRFLKAVDFVDDPAANRNGLLSTPGGQPALEGQQMNPKLRKYLETLGLSTTASDAEAKTFMAALKGEQLAKAKKLLNKAGDGNGDGDGAGAGEGGDGDGDSDEDNDDDPQPAGQAAGAGGAAGLSNGGQGSGQPSNGGGAAPALTDQQADEVLRRAQQRLNRRRESLTALAARTGMPDGWVNEQLASGASDEAILTSIANSTEPVAGLASRVTGGEDGRVALCQAIEDAIALQSDRQDFYELADSTRRPTDGPVVYALNSDGSRQRRQPTTHARRMAHLSIEMMGRHWAQHLGVADAMSLEPKRIFDLLTDRQELTRYGVGGIALAHSTSDFPIILANVLNKELLAAYDEEESTWEMWAVDKELKDFREARINQLGQIGTPPRVREGQEYTYGTLGEKYETVQAFKYGVLLALTWEMFVNDDMGAFVDGAFGFAQAAHALENDLVYAQVTGNQTMTEDSTACFHADHNNLNEGGDLPFDIGPLASMRAAMRLQRGIETSSGAADGRRLNLRPNALMVPVELEVSAAQKIASIAKPGASNEEPNPEFVRSLKLIPESRLSDNSTTAYYLLAAGKRNAPAGVVAHLRGYRTPTIERINTGSSVDGVTYKLRHVAGGRLGDFRSWQRNDGTPAE